MKVAALDEVRDRAAGCRNCELWRNATKTVFGEGKAPGGVMLVGEQPGDQEDKQGHPFVGPAGRLLNDALRRAAIDPDEVYLTNAVKHFKWEPRGKRRIHKRPSAAEVAACRPWLDSEIDLARPRAIVCLGVTAGKALLGPRFTVSGCRGELFHAPGRPPMTATVHPSAILRTEPPDRDAEMERFVADLAVVR